MTRKAFSEERILGVLREHAEGAPVATLAARHDVSERTIRRWLAEYPPPEPPEVARLHEHEPGHDLHEAHGDRVIGFLHQVIRFTVRVLAVLMVLVIVWGIGDVIYVLFQRLAQPPYFLLQINDILATFGAFLAVLIAIEIFINIRLYLHNNVIPVRLVVATARMAIARKVIIFDFEKLTPMYILATAAVVLSLGVTYWLITKKS